MADSNEAKLASVGLLEEQWILRDSLAQVLEQHGHPVTLSCGNPREVIEALAMGGSAEILIADVGPFGEDGWKALFYLREWHPHLRLLLLSSSHDPAELERTQRLGASGFLHKDFSGTGQLLETLARISGGDRVFPVADFTLARPAGSNGQLPEQSTRLRSLTTRELEVLRHIGSGCDNLKIAALLNISERTVRAHVSNLYRKLGPENRTQLALLCRELGIAPTRT